MVTIKEVALDAGVSTATVSRVLSGTDRVSAHVREKVLRSVGKLGYSPNRVARSLRVRKSRIIGLIVADIENTFFTEVSRSVQDRAYEEGYSVFLCNTDGQEEKQEEYLRFMREENAAGIILAPAGDRGLAMFRNPRDIPVVLIDREIEANSFDTILVDNGQASRRLAEHLLAAGRKRIAMICGKGSTTASERIDGYKKALEDSGMPFLPELLFRTDATEKGGWDAMAELLRLQDIPDAVISTNGLMAAGIFRKMKEDGISIPSRMAFCTFDETLWTPLVTPAVTVVRQPTKEIGREAVRILLDRIGGVIPEAPGKMILGTKLILRESSFC